MHSYEKILLILVILQVVILTSSFPFSRTPPAIARTASISQIQSATLRLGQGNKKTDIPVTINAGSNTYQFIPLEVNEQNNQSRNQLNK